MRCPVCTQSELEERIQNYNYNECGLSNVTLVGISVLFCPECGSLMPRIRNMEGLHDCIAQILIKKEERLLPEEIVFLRKSLGWSGSDFARNMHSEPAQVSKWEHGKVPMSKSNELLFREIVARGKKITDYHREDAAVKAAEQHSLMLQEDESRRWKLAA